MICKICDKSCTGAGFSKHIHSKHNVLPKDYYDKYLKIENEGICPVCGNETPFLNLSKGYQKHCSCKCAQNNAEVANCFRTNNPQKDEAIKEKTRQTCLQKYGAETLFASSEIQAKIRQNNLKKYGVENAYQIPHVKQLASYNSHKNDANEKRRQSIEKTLSRIEKDNNCTYIQTMLKRTKSSGWYQANIVDLVKYDGRLYVKNEDIPKIVEYDNNSYKTSSFAEKQIVDLIKSEHCGVIIENSRKIISPKELDIYLLEMSIAIEYNGLYYHSTLANCPVTYHLHKSLECRKQNIRLIHIYEFEDLQEQIGLLMELIKGNDLYPKDDFNKNSLITKIPNPVIIYSDKRLNVYGAGPLY